MLPNGLRHRPRTLGKALCSTGYRRGGRATQLILLHETLQIALRILGCQASELPSRIAYFGDMSLRNKPRPAARPGCEARQGARFVSQQRKHMSGLETECCESTLRPQPSATTRLVRIRPRLQIRRLKPQCLQSLTHLLTMDTCMM